MDKPDSKIMIVNSITPTFPMLITSIDIIPPAIGVDGDSTLMNASPSTVSAQIKRGRPNFPLINNLGIGNFSDFKWRECEERLS
jgi:hypothetical protein